MAHILLSAVGLPGQKDRTYEHLPMCGHTGHFICIECILLRCNREYIEAVFQTCTNHVCNPMLFDLKDQLFCRGWLNGHIGLLLSTVSLPSQYEGNI